MCACVCVCVCVRACVRVCVCVCVRQVPTPVFHSGFSSPLGLRWSLVWRLERMTSFPECVCSSELLLLLVHLGTTHTLQVRSS